MEPYFNKATKQTKNLRRLELLKYSNSFRGTLLKHPKEAAINSTESQIVNSAKRIKIKVNTRRERENRTVSPTINTTMNGQDSEKK